MSRQPSLKRPPIHEALIDIRCVVPETFSAASNADVASSLGASLGLDVQEVRKVRDAKIGLDSQSTHVTVESSDEMVERVVLKNQSGDRVVQLWADGVTASHLFPYGGWGDLESLSERAFEAWAQLASPIDVRRLAARFINRIGFEGQNVDLDRLFTCAPEVPDGLPDDLFYFTSRVGIQDKSRDLIAWVLLEAAPHLTRGTSGVIVLDIDVVKERRFGSFRFSDLRPHLAAIRDMKNAAFFGAITGEKLKDYE